MSLELIPGLEAFMEDADIDVEVNVGAPEEVAEEVEQQMETSDAGEEVAEVAEEGESTETETEMILARFDDLARQMKYVQTYGVDRAFLALNNYDGRLERAFRITLPSCESFDATGSPYSAESIACMEGFKEAMERVWSFIKSVAEKVKNFVLKIANAVINFFVGIERTIKRLKEAAKKLTGTNKSTAKKKLLPLSEATQATADYQSVCTSVEFIAKKLSTDFATSSVLDSDGSAKSYEDKLKALNEAKSITEKNVETEAKSVDINKYLDLATKICQNKTAMENASRSITAAAKKAVDVAKQNERLGEGDADGKIVETAKKNAKALSTVNKYFGKVGKESMTVAKECVKAASFAISNWSDKEEKKDDEKKS